MALVLALAAAQRVKVVGEHNTGTNWVEQLVRDNVRHTVLRGVCPKGCLDADRFFSVQSNWCATLGWKHSFPPTVAQLAACPQFDRCGNASFLITVKNPYAWFVSMYRHPYEIRHSNTFDAFVQAPIRAHSRENANFPEHKNLARLWNLKYAAWLSMPAKCTAVLKYEDMLGDPTGVFKKALDALSLSHTSPIRISTASAKHSKTKNFSTYAEYYLQQKWAAMYTPQLLQWLQTQLDHDLMRHFGYSILNTSN